MTAALDDQAGAPAPDTAAGATPAAGAGMAPAEMLDKATEAANFLKALAHEGRLMILCHLSTGEKSVSELEQCLNVRQAAVSQQLARLRLEGLVAARRDGKTIYYSLADPRSQRLIGVMYDLFCKDGCDT